MMMIMMLTMVMMILILNLMMIMMTLLIKKERGLFRPLVVLFSYVQCHDGDNDFFCRDNELQVKRKVIMIK